MIGSGALGAFIGWLVVSLAVAVGEGVVRREVAQRHSGGRLGFVADKFIVSAPGALLAAGALLALDVTTRGHGFSGAYAGVMLASALMIIAGLLAAKVGFIAQAHRRLALASGPAAPEYTVGVRR